MIIKRIQELGDVVGDIEITPIVMKRIGQRHWVVYEEGTMYVAAKGTIIKDTPEEQVIRYRVSPWWPKDLAYLLGQHLITNQIDLIESEDREIPARNA